MPHNPDDIRRAVHSLLNHVVEQSFMFMLEHPEYESEAQSIIGDASQTIRELVSETNAIKPPQADAPRVILAEYNQRLSRISDIAQERSLCYLGMLQGLQRVVRQ